MPSEKTKKLMCWLDTKIRECESEPMPSVAELADMATRDLGFEVPELAMKLTMSIVQMLHDVFRAAAQLRAMGIAGNDTTTHSPHLAR